MANNLRDRTFNLALLVIKLAERLPMNPAGRNIADQIIRSSTSVAANYRACCLAKSKRDFINKLKIVEEETDETILWLEIVERSGLSPLDTIQSLKTEATEILHMIVASIKTARKNMHQTSNQ
ncbi:MAG TPA: four helix bundle protein [Bacteroidales bacterium]|nr:four helix bundle protein [Bacteroidales bacterium]HPS62477.1 four helix bundle protein [Bacteroidales bacterium]